MTPRIFAPAALLGLLAATAPAATYVDALHEYTLEVPDGWRHKFDPEEQVLHLGAPGGYRMRIEAGARSGDITKGQVVEHFQADGKQLQAVYGGVKVLAKPHQASKLDKNPAYGYGLLYKEIDDVVHEVDVWLASGPSASTGRLHVKLRAFGPRVRALKYQKTVAAILRSFRFPAAPEPTPDEGGGAASAVLALVRPGVGGPAGPTAATRPTRSTRKPRAAGATVAGHNEEARAYDRGSLSGGAGFMKDAAVITDQRRVDMMKKAFSVGNGTRTEEQKKRAAKYLGFDL